MKMVKEKELKEEIELFEEYYPAGKVIRWRRREIYYDGNVA